MSTETSQQLYESGKNSDADHGRLLQQIIEHQDPEFVFRAGRLWPVFDDEKGLSALIQLKSAKFIYHAGLEWTAFNWPQAMDALCDLRDATYLFYAGAHWKNFDYDRGMAALLKTKNCEYLFRAGVLWPSFNYELAWRVLEAEVESGETWRGMAFENPRWKGALSAMWKTFW